MPTLLQPTDHNPFRIVNAEGQTPLLLVCDHASNHVPEHLNNLGLSQEVLNDHVAWDPGAARVTEILCSILDCRAVLGTYSRLLVDPNRDPSKDDPSLIPAVSDNYPIPGNQSLTAEQRQQRIDEIHEPYHQAIDQQANALTARVEAPMVFSIHTFTAKMSGALKPRPWHAGVLWRADPRLAQPLMHYLRQHDHLVIGDNQPYSGREIAYTTDRHGHHRGFPSCAIEIRQDLLLDDTDCLWWGQHLAEALRRVLNKQGIHNIQHYTEDGQS